jgi:ElaB/YqjD/DUF883 family membrane-anchored ribosome-binding protein
MADTKERVADAGEEAASKAKGVAETVAKKADEVMNDSRDFAGHLTEQSRQGYRQVAAHARNGMQQASASVRAYPGLAVTAAFGLGVALGVVIGMSSRPSRRNDFSSHFHRPNWLG